MKQEEGRHGPAFWAWLDVLQTEARVGRALERALQAERGLSLASFEALIRLGEAPGGRLHQKDLAEALWVTKSGATRLVDRLEADGLVERRPDPANRRYTYATITDRGREALRAAIPTHLRAVAEHFSRHLSGEDERALRAALGKVIRAAGGASAGARPANDR